MRKFFYQSAAALIITVILPSTILLALSDKKACMRDARDWYEGAKVELYSTYADSIFEAKQYKIDEYYVAYSQIEKSKRNEIKDEAKEQYKFLRTEAKKAYKEGIAAYKEEYKLMLEECSNASSSVVTTTTTSPTSGDKCEDECFGECQSNGSTCGQWCVAKQIINGQCQATSDFFKECDSSQCSGGSVTTTTTTSPTSSGDKCEPKMKCDKFCSIIAGSCQRNCVFKFIDNEGVCQTAEDPVGCNPSECNGGGGTSTTTGPFTSTTTVGR